MSPRLRLEVLGSAALSCPESCPWPLPLQQLALLTYLALVGPDPVPRQRLIALFWPDAEAERGRHSLSNALYGIRRCVGQGALHTVGHAVWIDHGAVTTDVHEFLEAVGDGDWTRAIELYRGPLLNGHRTRSSTEFDAWLTARRLELSHQYAEALLQSATAAEDAGDLDGAARRWRRLTVHDAHNSQYAAGLVRALWRAGHAEEALLHARRHETRLARELDIRPHAMLRALVDEIRRDVRPEPDRGRQSRSPTDVASSRTSPPRRAFGLPLQGSAVPWVLAAAAAVSLAVLPATWRAESDPVEVLVADFDQDVADPELAVAVTEGLRLALAGDGRVRLVSSDRVRVGLHRMRARAGNGLPAELARELAVREGVGGVLEGSVRSVGGKVLLIGRVVDPSSGEVISDAAHREVVHDAAADLATATHRLAGALAKAIAHGPNGEAPGSGLATVTTTSVEALRLYSRARRKMKRHGGEPDAARLLERAVTIDPSFASAHLELGIIRRRMSQRTLAREAIATAYRQRDALPPVERMRVTAEHRLLQGDLTGALEAFEQVLANQPDDALLLQAVADARAWLGQWDSAASHLERAIGVDSEFFDGWAELARARWQLGDSVGAWRVVAGMRGRFRDDARLLEVESRLAMAKGDLGTALEFAEARLAESPPASVARLEASFATGVLALAAGRVEQGLGFLMSASETSWALGRRGAAVAFGAVGAYGLLRVTQDPDRSLRWLNGHQARFPLDSVPELDRPYLNLAVAHAALGRVDSARAMVGRHHDQIDATFLRFEQEPIERFASAAVQVATGEYEGAFEDLKAAYRAQRCKRCTLPTFAEIAARRDLPVREIAILQAYLAEPHWTSALEALPAQGGEPFWLAPSLERLAVAYADAGLSGQSAACDRLFVELWSAADGDLQPRVQAARERLASNPADARGTATKCQSPTGP